MTNVEIAPITIPKIEDMYGVLSKQNLKAGKIAYEFSEYTIVKERTYTSIQISETEHLEDFVGKFFNHSCSPNLRFVSTLDHDRFYMETMHTINKGDELTFDYRTTESEIARPFICKCCSKEINTNEVRRIS